MNSSPQCAIVMPAYNEEACIGPVCLEWLRLSGERGFLMIVVDDGSDPYNRFLIATPNP